MASNYIRALAFFAGWTSLAYAGDGTQRTFEMKYRVTLGDVPGPADVWIPVPQTKDHQTIVGLSVDTEVDFSFVTDAEYGNRFVFLEFNKGGGDVVVSFIVERKVCQKPEGGDANPLSDEDRLRYLSPSRMVTTDGIVRAEAQRIAGDATSTFAKARRLYNHIVDTVRYDKSGKGWGRGDAIYACDTRSGNCTDFHSLFIGEARSIGVPSRFLMGFSVPNEKSSGEINGYHCWAEFHEDGAGWIPLDASEAFKDQSRRDELFGGLDADRVQFTVGRDITLPGMTGEPLNFAIYPYVEVDGKPIDSVMYSFRYRDIVD